MSNCTFEGFPERTFTFLDDLAKNNSKDWFEANRKRYDEYWKLPAFKLIDALVEPMKALSPALKSEARINGSLRRINRDVRFSKDKTPYSARMHLVFWSGSHPNRSAGFHLVLHPDKIGCGAGAFGFGPKELAVYRKRLLDDADRAVFLSAISRAKTARCDFGKPDLVNLPKGYVADEDWEHLLRRKSFVMRTMQDQEIPDWIRTDQAVPEIMKLAKSVIPFIEWLAKL